MSEYGMWFLGDIMDGSVYTGDDSDGRWIKGPVTCTSKKWLEPA